MTDFHVWRQIVGGIDECKSCSVIAPKTGADHCPVPIFCPGPVDGPTHIFIGNADEMVCTRCGTVLPRGTMPNEMVWVCDTPWQAG